MQSVQPAVDSAASNPPFVLYAALISAAVAIVVLVASNYYNSKREYETWRREELAKAVLESLTTMSRIKDINANNPAQYNQALLVTELSRLHDLEHSMNLLAASQKFGHKYSKIVSELLSSTKTARRKGVVNREINEIQIRFTKIAQWELRRTTWGPVRKVLALLVIVVLLPILIVLVIVLVLVQAMDFLLRTLINNMRKA